MKWKKPRQDHVKANWDAVVDKKGRKVGIGVVIIDEEGKVLVAIGGQRNNVDQPTIAETHALWKVMELCRRHNSNEAL